MKTIYEEIDAADYLFRNNKEKTSEDHLYFLVTEGKVKIGKSKNIESRMKQLQTALSNDYCCYCFHNKGFLETKLHRIYKEFRLRGEWFVLNNNISRFIERYNERIVKSDKYNYEIRQDYIITRGKYKNKSLKYIWEVDKNYFNFLLDWSSDNYKDRAKYSKPITQYKIPRKQREFIREVVSKNTLNI